jgi:6-phospho-beta-glucosidase
MNIAILGGSSVGTPELVLALQRAFPAPPPRALRLTLHGRTADKLEPVGRAARALAAGCDWLHVRHTTDLAAALDGADIVVNQVRVGGLAARADDETFPLALGMLGEETVGAGGFANAVRTIPAVLELARAIEHHAPRALLLSFTNPASLIQAAIARATTLRVIGLCDASILMRAQAAAALGRAPTDIEIDYVGMHHFSFVPRVHAAGVDVTGAMLNGLGNIAKFDMNPADIAAFGVLPTP